jgi:hypothetical protein
MLLHYLAEQSVYARLIITNKPPKQTDLQKSLVTDNTLFDYYVNDANLQPEILKPLDIDNYSITSLPNIYPYLPKNTIYDFLLLFEGLQDHRGLKINGGASMSSQFQQPTAFVRMDSYYGSKRSHLCPSDDSSSDDDPDPNNPYPLFSIQPPNFAHQPKKRKKSSKPKTQRTTNQITLNGVQIVHDPGYDALLELDYSYIFKGIVKCIVDNNSSDVQVSPYVNLKDVNVPGYQLYMDYYNQTNRKLLVINDDIAVALVVSSLPQPRFYNQETLVSAIKERLLRFKVAQALEKLQKSNANNEEQQPIQPEQVAEEQLATPETE